MRATFTDDEVNLLVAGLEALIRTYRDDMLTDTIDEVEQLLTRLRSGPEDEQ
jgi:hypothetical protein